MKGQPCIYGKGLCQEGDCDNCALNPTVGFFRVDIICAWCGIKIGEKGGFTSKEPTHGMCEKCYGATMAEINEMELVK